MPPTAFTAGLTLEEKVVYQRERNKIKQQNLRARRAAAKEAENNNNNNNNNNNSRSASSSGGGGKTTTRTAPSTQAQKAFEQLKQKKNERPQEEEEGEKIVDTSAVARMAKRLAELGEGEEEILKLVEGGKREEGPSSNGKKRARMDPTSFSEFIASPSSEGGGGSTPSSSSSATSSSSSSSKRLTSFSLFAALLNGSLPPPKPLHLLTSLPTDSRALLIILHPDFNPSALSSLSSPPKPPFHVPARELPSYSYASPVDLDIGRYPSMNPLQSVDWKVRLFQLHSAMHRERMHPTEGYLVNVGLQETVAKAQLLILQLLGASSNQKARFDARRTLSIEDQNYLDYAPMDPRMEWFPDPLVRVHTARTASKGGVNLTEMTGMGIETATLYGDSWDFGAWAMDHHTHVPYIPDCSISPIGFKCQGGGPNHPPHSPGELGGGFGQHVGLLGNHLGLKGSTIREIVLGLEIPNSRTREPVFTSVPEGLWEHLTYDDENPMHEIAWRAGGAAEVHAAIIQSWCDEEAAKKKEREGQRVRS